MAESRRSSISRYDDTEPEEVVSVNQSLPVSGVARFRAVNPALFTMLITFLLVTLLTGGLTVFALTPAAGEPPAVVTAFGSMNPLLVVSVLVLLVAGWLISGFAGERRWLQVIACVVVLAATAWLSGLLALSVLLAGLKH